MSVLEKQLTTLDISPDEREVLLKKVEECVNDLSKQSNIDSQLITERVFTAESYEVTLNAENTSYKPTLLDRIWGLFSNLGDKFKHRYRNKKGIKTNGLRIRVAHSLK